MSKYGVHVDYNPADPGEKWKRTVASCLARLKECEAGMDRDLGDGINLRWYYWNCEWGIAWEWLQRRAPRMARKLEAEMNAAAGTDAV